MRAVTYGFGMRSPVWRVGAALAVLVAALAVGGCVEDEPDTTPNPEPTSTPLFESDEEALAAAEEAYGRYQAVEAEILADGGTNSERIEGLAVRDALVAAEEGFADYRANGYRNIGATKFETVELQHYSASSEDSKDVVGLYICLDFSSQDVVNAQSVSVVRPGRIVRQAFEVSFDLAQSGDELVLAAREPWGSNDVCAA